MIQLHDALAFLESIDALKNTYRKCLIMNGERYESTAEHSFSFAMAVMAFQPFANQPIDVTKAMKMALCHDLAEAVMGDTFHYSKPTEANAWEAELAGLKKVLAPIASSPLFDEICELWLEFENGSSAEAVFLRGLDRFLPMYHNFKTKGHTWVKHGITQQQALAKNAHIEQSSNAVWDFTKQMLDESKANGWIL